MLETGGGLPVRGPHEGVDTGLAEIAHRLRPHLGAVIVKSESDDVRIQVVGINRFDRLGHAAVKDAEARCQQLDAHNLTDTVVREVEAFLDTLEDSTSDQLL